MTAVYARRSPIFQDVEIKKNDGKVDIARTGDFLKKEGPQGPKGKYEAEEKFFSNVGKKLDLGKVNSDVLN